MGIPLSRIEPSCPPWFPAEVLAAHIASARAGSSESVVFERLERNLSANPIINRAEIRRGKRLGGLFTVIEANVEAERRRIGPRIAGAPAQGGIAAQIGWTDPPVSLLVTLSASLKSHSARCALARPFMSGADFGCDVPFSEASLAVTHEKRVRSDQSITRAAVASQIDAFTVKVERVDVTGEGVRPSMMYYEPSTYVKAGCAIGKRGGKYQWNGEVAGVVPLDGSRPVAMLKLNSCRKWEFGGFIQVRADTGAITSTDAVPFAERFHIGGVPVMRGIERGKFSPKSGGIAAGSDLFGVASALCRLELLPRLHFQVFGHAGASALMKSNHFLDATPATVAAVTYGCGYAFSFKGCVLELNYNVPVVVSPELNFCRFQWAVRSKDK